MPLKQKNMKSIIGLLLLSITCLSCKAQNSNSLKLNNEHYDVLNAFINQKYDFKEHFYLNKYLTQKKYTGIFGANYIKNLSICRNSDSICKNSNDTLTLKFKCPMAFSLKKYIGLFSEKDLEYFKNTYKQDVSQKFIIDSKKMPPALPIITEHSNDFYKVYLKDKRQARYSFLKESPSLEIQGIYFSENKKIALVTYTMVTSTMGGGLAYSIMQKEDGVWWRLIGSIQITYV